MNFSDSDRPRRKSAVLLFLVIVLIAGLAAGAWYLRPRFESEPPQIAFKPDSDTVGRGTIEIVITDKGTGLKSIEVKLGETSIATLLPMMNLARFYAATDRCVEKAAYIEHAVALCKEHAPADSPMIGSALRTQGECRIAQGDLAGAEAPLVEGELRLSKIFSGDEAKIREMREEIAKLYDKLGKPDKAAAYRAMGAKPRT